MSRLAYRTIDANAMITMPPKRLNIPHPQRPPAKRSAASGHELSGPLAVLAAPPAATTRLPRRPDPSVLSEAIPVFFIGKNKDGFWVAREAEGRTGGIFLFKNAALRFANSSTESIQCATMLLSECIELDIENEGNPLITHLGATKRVVTRIALRAIALLGKAAGIGQARV